VCLAAWLCAPSRGAAKFSPPGGDLEEKAAQVLREFAARADRLKFAGDVYFELGELDRAAQCWREASALKDTDELHGRLARLYRRRKEFDKLVALRRRRLSGSPTPQRRAALAEALQLAGREKEAERMWLLIVAEERWSESSVQRLVASCLAVNRADFAAKILEKRAATASGAMLFNYAELLGARRRFSEAAQAMERYLDAKATATGAATAGKRWAWFVVAAGREGPEGARLDKMLAQAEEQLIRAYLEEMKANPSRRARERIARKLRKLAPRDARVRAALGKLDAPKATKAEGEAVAPIPGKKKSKGNR